MSVKIKSVVAVNDLNIVVTFVNGITKRYDVKRLFQQFDWYKELENPDIFNLVQVDCGGCGVAWNEDIDISECEIWENGETVATPFDSLLSFAEASELWGIDDSTLRKAVASRKLIENVDVRKFGKQWVISRSAMERTFGEEQNERKYSG
ncbi:MAG: helix-turn-helix domain-containing protein [Bacteroides sp.]|nr:helix-turn-helix domain-containing protein [Eubacterium sp.]MCM1463753.1 helix-turn-helix domain-containing protein [Bacteroides sp.]